MEIISALREHEANPTTKIQNAMHPRRHLPKSPCLAQGGETPLGPAADNRSRKLALLAGISAFLLQKFGIFPSPQVPAHPAVPPHALRTMFMVNLCSKLIFHPGTEPDISFLLCCPQSCSGHLLIFPVALNRRGNNYIWGNFTPICIRCHRLTFCCKGAVSWQRTLWPSRQNYVQICEIGGSQGSSPFS